MPFAVAAHRIALENPLVQFDPDTRDFIMRVERADGQALEASVRRALDAFVRGCKADGIWNAIQACCIMMGARTLAGALTPLKGAAPTNFNFVSGDYDRKTGLAGNGTTKYLNSNRNNNSDPQNSKHLAVFLSAAASSASATFRCHIGMAPFTGQVGASILGIDGAGATVDSARARANGATALVNASGLASGFRGVSRTLSSEFVGRLSGADTVQSATSETPAAGNIFVHARNVVGASVDAFSNSRLSYYSIGESLDLAFLDARVTALSTAIAAAF